MPQKKTICPIQKVGSTEIRTRILGFRVPGANRYTIEPAQRAVATKGMPSVFALAKCT